MKYVILIHSNPQPWGHPTGDFLAAHQALPVERQEQLNKAFDQLLEELHANGELVHAEALGDPATSRLYRWGDEAPVVTDGPYADAEEHLAGLFIVDVASQARADEIAAVFAGPGETIELRPAYVWPDAAG